MKNEIKLKVISTFWRDGYFYKTGEVVYADSIAKKQLVDEMCVCCIDEVKR